MQYDLTRQFSRTVIELLEHTYARQGPLVTLNLGGTSGSNGGTGGPPGGFNSQIAQKYVTFDTSENESQDVVGGSGSTASLVDNLNRIRLWLHPARWFLPHMEDSTLYVDAGIWWTGAGTYLDYAGTDMPAPASGKVWLDSSGSLCTGADWPGGTFNPICEMAGSTISKDARRFFNEGGASGSGGGTPGGSDTNIQFNDSGVFGGSNNLTWNGSRLFAQTSDVGTTNWAYPSRLSHITSGTVAAGFGVGQEFYLHDASGSPRSVGETGFRWHTVAAGSELASYVLYGYYGSKRTEIMVITPYTADEYYSDGGVRGAGSIDIQTYRVGEIMIASGVYSTIIGGIGNTAQGEGAVCIGGSGGGANGYRSVVIGGLGGWTPGSHAVSIGGWETDAIGDRSVSIGGKHIRNYGDSSVAFGTYVHITGSHPGTFIFSDDSAEVDFHSQFPEEFAIRVVNGLRVAYNDSTYFRMVSGSNGDVTLDITHASGSPVFTFGHNIALSALTAKNLLYTNASKEVVGLANGETGYLYNDSLGNFSWQAVSGGSGSPAGSNTQVQFNDNGVFGASGSFTWNGTGLGIGIAARYLLDVAGTGTDSKASVQRSTAASAASAAGWRVIRSRGTVASPSAILSGDYLGYMEFAGFYNASAVLVGGYVAAVATQDWTSGSYGTKLRFGIHANGSASGSEPLELTNTALKMSSGSGTGTLRLEGGGKGGTNVSQLSFDRYGTGELARIDVIRGGADDAGAMRFWTKDTTGALTERARFTPVGVLEVYNNIKFPATQVPSSDANTFDDYEELPWTPALKFGGNSAGMAYTTQIGWYTKWGRVIFAGFTIALSAKGASVGAATITGLPYAPVGNSTVVPYYANMSGIANVFLLRVVSAGCALFDAGATGPTALTDANFNNNSFLNTGFVYSV